MTHTRRGREATRPHAISGSGWYDILWRVHKALVDDRVTMLAAGIAFYALLALFPAIAAIISFWALVFDPQDIARQIIDFSRILPPGAASLVGDQAREISDNTSRGLSLTAVVGVVVSLFVASKGVRGMIVGLNVVYGEGERRTLWRRGLVVGAMTVGLVVVTLVTMLLVALVPLVIDALGLDPWVVTGIRLLRWPILLLVMMFLIAVLYRFGPYRRAPRWEWLSVGTVSATLLWLLGSGGLSLYVGHMSTLNQLYGSLGAVVVLMLWFWLSAFVVLLGGEINSEMERQTRRDTTVGDPRPPGERGAHAADTLGRGRP